ncbi:MAG TPA: Uma2 family endonuclease [Thermoanaerobaculia bacterium]|nr:Uma2 family endonuclease [Thermoanaerobaculia bacterium]
MAEPIRSLPFTYDDYLLLPEDGPRYELIEGELLMTPAPLMGHQRLSSRLHVRIGSFVERHGLGEVFAAPTDVYLSPTNVVQPDLLFVAKEHLDRVVRACLQGPPDLVIEILSDGSRERDEVAKLRLYAKFGVPEYWLADAFRQAVRVHRLANGTYRMVAELGAEAGDHLTSPLLPGLDIDLAELFDR